MFQGMLIEKIENRILVGTLVFLGMMILIGWVAINEPGRMQAFEEQHLARSIERGAALFAANCTTCHGNDGRGIPGNAPGLNNPALFGHNFFEDIDDEVARLQSLQTELADLRAEYNAETTTLARKDEIDAQLAGLVEEFGDDIDAGIVTRLGELEQERQALLLQMQPAITNGYDPNSPSRTAALGWEGTLDALVHTTLVSGRPTSTSYWPKPMAAWSQTAGGPLRDDQIENLVTYIMNWDRSWTLDDLLAVNQFAIKPVKPGEGAAVDIVPVGADVPAILTQLEEVNGDPLNGQTVYAGQGCAGCHNQGLIGPNTEGTWTRINETRLMAPELAGYTAEQYLVESIVHPEAYISPNYPAGQMTADFGEKLNIQMLADLVAYLMSQDQPDPLAN